MDAHDIIALIKREVVPAIGCTEPVAVALCVAKAVETLGSLPANISVALSGNMLKNAMGVGIPGTGMTGLPIAIALGAIVGRADLGLEVLRDVNPEAVKKGEAYIAEKRIRISHNPEAPSKLFIDAKVTAADGSTARTVIAGSHTNYIRIEKEGEIIFDKEFGGDNVSDSDPKLSLGDVYEFAVNTPLADIEFIEEAERLNSKAASCAFDHDYGHCLGKTVLNQQGLRYLGDTPLAHMIAYTSAACDARMGGCPVAVMSNSGSGNQGITCTMPVVVFARECGADHEHKIRALIMSHLTSIYIKQGLGRLSALCGCVVASTGASAGITYLMGGDYRKISMAIKNMVANLTGMICDGAKPSCAMKISSGVSTAMLSALLAMNEEAPDESEGIICNDIDRTIHNLTSIGKEAMQETDKYVLKIMVEKE